MMNDGIDKSFLCEQAELYGITINNEAAERFTIYSRMLIEWNKKINLTAIIEPKEIVVKHFIDSLILMPMLPDRQCSLIDVGTGAGFPGLPLAIMNKNIQLTLLDSLNKRLLFLKNCCTELGIQVHLVHARAEEAGSKPEIREKFDVVTARAVAALPVLCEYCLPLAKIGGKFIAMKGPDGEAETDSAKKAISMLGGKLTAIERRQLTAKDETMERRLIIIDKIVSTPSKYPRNSAKIKKEPL